MRSNFNKERKSGVSDKKKKKSKEPKNIVNN